MIMKERIRKYWSWLLVVGLLCCLHPQPLEAQCPMCRMSAESNLKDGGSAGKGLNNGILYMLATPYLLVLGIGVFWYYNRNKSEDIKE